MARSKKPKGWVKEPVRHGLAARGIITAPPIPPNLRGPDGIRREPKEDLEAYFRLIQKFRPHWDFEVLDGPVEILPYRGPTRMSDIRSTKAEHWRDPEQDADGRMDEAIEELKGMGLDSVADDVAESEFQHAREALVELEVEGAIDTAAFDQAMSIIEFLEVPDKL